MIDEFPTGLGAVIVGRWKYDDPARSWSRNLPETRVFVLVGRERWAFPRPEQQHPDYGGDWETLHHDITNQRTISLVKVLSAGLDLDQ